jgi:hypothetical protein
MSKERELTEEVTRDTIEEFSSAKGVCVATFVSAYGSYLNG